MELCATKMKLISEGAGSYIYSYGELQQLIAIKMVKSNSKQSKHLYNEYTILKQLHHDYIITPFKFQRNVNTENLRSENKNQNNQICSTKSINQFLGLSDILVLQYAQRGSLIKVIKQNKPSIPQVRYLFQQICEAVDYLHCNYIVHRDLKLQNIFMCVEDSKLVCKLGDFGFASSCYRDSQLILFNGCKGTRRGYMAPEIYATLKNPESYYDARKSDVFALGVILFAMVLGRLPFQYATMQNNLYKFIAQEKYDKFWNQHNSSLRKLSDKDFSMVEDFKRLFISMVKLDANSRVNMQDVLDDDWFQGKKQQFNV